MDGDEVKMGQDPGPGAFFVAGEEGWAGKSPHDKKDITIPKWALILFSTDVFLFGVIIGVLIMMV